MNKYSLLVFAFVFFGIESSHGQANSALDSYTSFLKTQNTPAKDYILSLFDNHDIVIICERFHGEMSQYELIADIISDKRFTDNVGNIFTEVGVSTLNPELNTFLHTKNLPEDTVSRRIINFQRNCSFWPLWSNKNYAFLLHTLYSVNSSLPAGQAINDYPSDLPFSWAGADSAAMLKLKAMMAGRDSIMAAQIIERFNEIRNTKSKRKKALIIMNYRHAFNQEFFIGDRSLKNTAYYLFKQYGNRVANVLLNTVSITNAGNFDLLQGGKWDAAFKALSKENAGFNLKETPFGRDSLDFWPYKTGFTYADIFTGFVFFLPVEKHDIIEGFSGLADEAFRPELLNRIDLICVLGGEFVKVRNMKQIVEQDINIFNTEEKKKYYQLDILISKREAWFK